MAFRGFPGISGGIPRTEWTVRMAEVSSKYFGCQRGSFLIADDTIQGTLTVLILYLREVYLQSIRGYYRAIVAKPDFPTFSINPKSLKHKVIGTKPLTRSTGKVHVLSTCPDTNTPLPHYPITPQESQ